MVIANATPEFRVVSGRRRMTDQQLQPLRGLKVPITEEVIEREQWEAFWDAPLYIEGSGVRPPSHGTSIPPMEGCSASRTATQAGGDHARDARLTRPQGCEVKTNGARLEITFPGAELGVFSGHLEYDDLQGHESDSSGPHRQDRSDLGRVQVRWRAQGAADSARLRVVWRDLRTGWQD